MFNVEAASDFSCLLKKRLCDETGRSNKVKQIMAGMLCAHERKIETKANAIRRQH